MGNPLQELQKFGQSVWYDNVSRGLIKDGSFQKFIAEMGVVGVTSNPTIFEKAIGGTADYDDQIKELIAQGKSATEIYDALAIQDITAVCDVFRPVYDRTEGLDGYVSIEVSPLIAADTEATIKDAKRYFETINRPNLMIKIPATLEGMAAIEATIAAGINVNVTMIFALEYYEKVAEAYISGLEKLAASGKKPLNKVASVASFFVSRVDVLADKLLDDKLSATSDEATKAKAESLHGKLAIANSKVVYEKYQEIFGSERFQKLKAQGAMPQRLLWASTGAKNPKYRDILYSEELVGSETVDTMPPATMTAFADHGKVRQSLTENVAAAHQVLKDFESVGISVDDITEQLRVKGVQLFADDFNKLLQGVEAKRQKVQAESGTAAGLGKFERAVEETINNLDEQNFAVRVWEKDASLWSSDGATQKQISNSLGWLTVGDMVLGEVPRLKKLAEQVKSEGLEWVVLLGMGGSSLAPEVLRQTFGNTAGYPKLLVIDTTDPGVVSAAQQTANPAKTLYIVSSKSGSTTEPNVLMAYYLDKVQKLKGDKAGQQFVAITDAGSSLEKFATENKFREIFLNPADIGGRYSALSFFGMVPAALAGFDVEQLLKRANAMAALCHAKGKGNPGLTLGATMGTLANQGRDKVTLVLPPALASYGLWVEQLIAESTGKEGRGLVPIAGEDLGSPEVYGNDRLFVSFTLGGEVDQTTESKLKALEGAGHPVVRLSLTNRFDIATEFFRWEFAVPVAGALIKINPFDQPGVQESKDNTKRLLAEYSANHKLPVPEAVGQSDSLTLYGPSGANSVKQYLNDFLAQVKPGDYVAIMAYIEYSTANDATFQDLRQYLRDKFKVATTIGYGPRFLHSTGQLHKGGANNGVFIQIIQDTAEDAPIPGEPFSFGTLIQAQALGDLQALESHGRRAISIKFTNAAAGFKELANALKA